jgi:hypothetical protein
MLRNIVSAFGYAVQIASTGLDAICAVPEFQPDVAFAAVLVRDKTPGVRLIREWLAMGAARNLASNRRDHRRGHVAKIGSAG